MTEVTSGKTALPGFEETGRAMAALGMSALGYAAIDDDLTQAKGADVYAKMRTDDDVKIGLTLKIGGVLAKGWKIAPGIEEGEPNYAKALEQAEFIEACLNDMVGSFDDILEEIVMDALTYGVAISEKNYILRGDGKIGYKSIKPKDATNYLFFYDEFMNLSEMKLAFDMTVLDINKFAIYTHNISHGALSGNSDLRSAHRYCWAKDRLLQWMLVFFERYAMPIVDGKYMAGTTKEQQDEMFRILRNLKNQTAMVHSDVFDVQLLQANGVAQMGFIEAIELCGKRIIKSIVGNTLTTDSGKTGSLALGEVHQDVLEIYITRLKRRAEEFVDEGICRDLVDINFAERFYPNFTLVVSEKDITKLAEMIVRLVTGEVVVPDEPWVRDYLGLPERAPGTPAPLSRDVAQQDALNANGDTVQAGSTKAPQTGGNKTDTKGADKVTGNKGVKGSK